MSDTSPAPDKSQAGPLNLVRCAPRLVSVVTPTHIPAAPFLLDAYRSLLQQDLDWEWIIQFDGQAWDPPDQLQADPRVHVRSNGGKLGVAATRNLALIRAAGEYVQILDADDQLHPGSIEALLAPLLADPDLAFCVARTDHLDGDHMRERDAKQDDHGRTRIPKPDGGVLKPGELVDYWLHYERMPFATQGTLWRKKFLLAYGGQVALDTGEDSCAALAISEQHPCFFLKDKWTLIYRAHEHSLMHHPHYFSISRPRSHIFVAQRLQALRKLRDPSRSARPNLKTFAGTEQQIADRERDVSGQSGKFSILTPISSTAEVSLLKKSYTSLCRQTTDWEWLLQVDAEECELPSYLTDDPRVKSAVNAGKMGMAITSNFALARSSGRYIQLLGPGQELTDLGLKKEMALLEAYSAAYLLTGEDGLPDRLPAGSGESLLARMETGPIDAASICWRRDALFAVGGCAAAPGEEIIAALIGVAEQYPGCSDAALTVRSMNQTQDRPGSTDTGFPLASARLKALQQLSG